MIVTVVLRRHARPRVSLPDSADVKRSVSSDSEMLSRAMSSLTEVLASRDDLWAAAQAEEWKARELVGYHNGCVRGFTIDTFAFF